MICEINNVGDDIYEVYNGNELITFRFAGFADRLGARLIDMAIIFIPAVMFPVLAPWLYWSIQQSSTLHSTVGQRAMGIKLIGTDGSDVGFGRASGRFFADIINSLLLFTGYLVMLFNHNHQCLHDMIAGCIVVRELNRTTFENSEL